MTYHDEAKKIQIPLCNIKDHKWSIQWLGGEKRGKWIGGQGEKGWKALHEDDESKRHFEKCLICGIARDDVDAVQT